MEAKMSVFSSKKANKLLYKLELNYIQFTIKF